MPYGFSDALWHKIASALYRSPKVKNAYIYGSRARGTHRPGSDCDLVVEGAELTPRNVKQILWELCDIPSLFKFDLAHWDTLTDDAFGRAVKETGVLIERPTVLAPVPYEPWLEKVIYKEVEGQ